MQKQIFEKYKTLFSVPQNKSPINNTNYTKKFILYTVLHKYPVIVEFHFELVEVQPLGRLLGLQVMVVVPGREPEGVKLPLGGQKNYCGGLLVLNPRISSCKCTNQ